MKFRQNSEARMVNRAAKTQSVFIIPNENIFEPRDSEVYPWVNSTAISAPKKDAFRDKLHGISKPTKMKRAISKNINTKMSNLNIKTIKSSLGNFFNPSVSG